MTAPRGFLHADLTRRLIGLYFDVYKELGGGFLESVYGNALAMALTSENIRFAREPEVVITFRGSNVGLGRPDFIVDKNVIMECKAVQRLEPWHRAQVVHYLRSSGLRVGLLLNFGPKAEFRRIEIDVSDSGNDNRKRDEGSTADCSSRQQIILPRGR